MEWPPLRARAVEADELRRHVPDALPIDLYERQAWLGITPFRLTGLQLVATPAVPRISTFPELNVRTYVTFEQKPGINFFSLDAASDLAVAAARRFYRLPYFDAKTEIGTERDHVTFDSRRLPDDASFRAAYRPIGKPEPAAVGTLEHFLAERYCLYSTDSDTLYRSEIHHPPWPLQAAEATISLNTMAPRGVRVPDECRCCTSPPGRTFSSGHSNGSPAVPLEGPASVSAVWIRVYP